MEVTAELRWFGPGPVPEDLDAWFRAPGHDFACSPGGGRRRTDRYFLTGAPDLAIKRRQGKEGLEVKGRVDILPWRHPWGGQVVAPRVYAKWSVGGTDLPGLPGVEVEKSRWLRRFATAPDLREIALGAGPLGEDSLNGERPEIGCDLELTRVVIAEEVWWSFAAEAFAPDGSDVPTRDLASRSLRAATRAFSGAPGRKRARYQDYGEWLAQRLEGAAPET